MKRFNYIILALAGLFTLGSCEKKDYPAGLESEEHHYYAIFVPNNNVGVSVMKSQTALIKFPVQFYSNFTRDYDAIGQYVIVTKASSTIAAPAIAGVDFNIVDKNGVVIPPVSDSTYNMVFPKAIKTMDTIYIKLLNNPVAGTRKMEIQMKENKTDQFYVDIFSTAFRRPVEIK